MASTFKIFQEGKDEIVTVYIDDAHQYLTAQWNNCGMYELPISWSTPSGNNPTIDWFKYVELEIANISASYILKDIYKNTADYSYYLYLNPNTADPENCYLIDGNYPYGNMSCISPQPSGAVQVMFLKIKSTDETKVVVDSSKNFLSYNITG